MPSGRISDQGCQLSPSTPNTVPTIVVSLLYVVVIGAVIAAVAGYMAGLIGSSNSPISGVGILVVLGIALLLAALHGPGADPSQTTALVAYALFTTAVVFSVATISNDNLQDLKTGQLVGATPWKQQVALVIGVVFGALVIAPVLDLLNAIPRDLILPPTSLYLVILAGLLLWWRRPRAGRIVAGTGLALLAFLSTTAGASLFVAPLERLTKPLQAPERAGAQAIVVLAAGRLTNAPEYDGRDIPDLIALARLRYGAHLARRTRLPVLVTGSNGASGFDPAPGERAWSKAHAMAAALQGDFGVPVRWIEPRARDTNENGTYSAALLRADGVKRILLVTDAMHMARARGAFERAGLEVVDAPTMFFSDQHDGLGAWLPSAEGMRRSWYAVYELIGMLWYRARAAAE